MYQKIRRSSEVHGVRQKSEANRRLYLYTQIFTDIAAIMKIFLPSDKAVIVSNHIKSIMYNLIELTTGKRPDNF